MCCVLIGLGILGDAGGEVDGSHSVHLRCGDGCLGRMCVHNSATTCVLLEYEIEWRERWTVEWFSEVAPAAGTRSERKQ